jgi:hypothetical protein
LGQRESRGRYITEQYGGCTEECRGGGFPLFCVSYYIPYYITLFYTEYSVLYSCDICHGVN